MFYTATGAIGKKIFKLENILDLFEVFHELKNEAEKEGRSPLLMFNYQTVNDQVDEKYKRIGITIRDPKDLDRKFLKQWPCRGINIFFNDYEMKREVKIILDSREGEGDNTIYVHAQDEKNNKWVKQTFEKIMDTKNQAESQYHWMIEYKKQMLLLGSFSFGYVILLILQFFDNYRYVLVNQSHNPLPWLELFMRYPTALTGMFLLLFIMGYGPFKLFQDWLLKLWPNVEFDIGPEFKNLIKRRRERIIALGASFLPLLDLIINIFRL